MVYRKAESTTDPEMERTGGICDSGSRDNNSCRRKNNTKLFNHESDFEEIALSDIGAKMRTR